jgi:hypothetical protein
MKKKFFKYFTYIFVLPIEAAFALLSGEQYL